MSFRALLPHRATIQEPKMVPVDGVASYEWTTVASNVLCRVDLTFIRRGKDPQWTPEAGRVEDRSGVAFFLPDMRGKVRPGSRIILTSGGIQGTFRIDGNVEEIIGRRDRIHHLEAGVTEVPGPLSKAV